MRASTSALSLTYRTIGVFIGRGVAFVSIMVGIAMVCIPSKTIFDLWATAITRSTRITTQGRTSFSATDVAVITGDGPLSSPDSTHRSVVPSGYTVSVKVILDYPKKVVVGDSFVLRATVRPTGDLEASAREMLEGSHEITFQQSELEGLDLNLAGADIEPKETNPLVNWTTIWSVQPKNAGRLTGIVFVVLHNNLMKGAF